MIPLVDTVQARHTPIATWGIILVNSLVFLSELSMAPEQLDSLVAVLVIGVNP